MLNTTAATNVSDATMDPSQAARFLRAFVECNRDMQELALEMAEIISDESSTVDERNLAFDAMVSALFPGTTSDVVDQYHERLNSADGLAAASEVRNEESHFADTVRSLMAEKGITQEQLASAVGIGQPAVSNLLTRRCRPQRRTIEKFSSVLGVEPSVLWPKWEG